MSTVADAEFTRRLGRRLFLGAPMRPVLAPPRAGGPGPVGEATSTFGTSLPGGALPTFVGNGSKVEHPDLQVIFWGPYWPGSGALTQNALMNAFRATVNGPYLSGLAQYGYAGPVNVRNPMVISSAPNIALPALAPGVSQSTTVYQAVYNFVANLVGNDQIPNVEDNHDLIVMVVLDPVVPFPQNQAAGAGGGTSTVFGSHGKLEIFEFLDDNTRFAVGWTGTNAAQGLSAFDQTTWTFSHELVESITNPFPNSGWVQTVPAPAGGSGEIADVCGAVAMVDGVAVASYWSIADGACIVPAEDRSCFLIAGDPNPSIPHDSEPRTAFHDFGKLCNSGYYSYVERTWDNTVTVQAQLKGYQSPSVAWTLNGTAIPAGASQLTVPATYERAGLELRSPLRPGGNPHPPTVLHLTNNNTNLVIQVGPNMGNVQLNIAATAVESWDGDPGTQVTTQKSATTFVAMTDQKIVWGDDYQRDSQECRKRHGLAAGPLGGYQGPRNPGDPGPDGIPPEVLQALRAQGAERAQALLDAARRVREANPELSAALEYYAGQHGGGG